MRWSAITLTVVALVPAMVAIWNSALGTGGLLGDFALLDLHLRDVFTHSTPLLGPYSRYGWNHPGPMLYYVMAPVARVLGADARATVITGTLVQVVGIVCVSRRAWRLGGVPLVAGAMLVVLVPYVAIGPVAIVAPWNPYITMPFFLLFILQVWSAVTGDTMQVLWAAIVGTFLVQTHIGYVPFVAVGALLVAIGLVIDGSIRRRSTHTVLIVAAGALALLWIPPVIDELTDRHNLDRVVSYFTRGHAERGASIDVAVRTVAGAFERGFQLVAGGYAPPRDALGLPIATPASWWWAALLAVLLVAGSAASIRSGRSQDRWLMAIVAAMALVAVPSMMGLEPPLYEYLMTWRLWLAGLVVLAAALAIAHLVGVARRSSLRAISTMLAAALLLGVSITYAVQVSNEPTFVPSDQSSIELSKQLLRHAPDGPVLLRPANFAFNGVFEGLVNELNRNGVDARVQPHAAFRFGTAHTQSPQDSTTNWYLATRTWDLDRVLAEPGAHVVARTTPLSERDDAEVVRLQAKIVGDLLDADRRDLIVHVDEPWIDVLTRDLTAVDHHAARRLAQLNNRVWFARLCRCTVISIPRHKPASEP